ncbi:MAG: bifunctional YncE family protein/alkaline phosphatase family protein [Gemmatimonadales bacterium]
MLLPLFLLVQSPAQPPKPPRRQVPDSGIIATEQRVTPAGVQSVFDGRVTAVRFGMESGEIWVAAPGGAWRLSWRDNRVVASSRFDGTPGVFGIALDRAGGRALFSSVGRLPSDVANLEPGARLPRARSVAQLTAFDARGVAQRTNGAGDSAAVVFTSGELGEFMAGGPAVASRANSTGKRLAILPLPANDRLAVFDADAGTRISTLPLGVLPVAAVIADDGSEAWVSVYGGSKPRAGERAAPQCCRALSEPVRVDAAGIAQPGMVVRVDLVAARVTDSVTVDRHPAGLAWDRARNRLYVANGNADNVSVVNTRMRTQSAVIPVEPFKERKVGLAPTAVALSADGNTLYVTLGGVNAVAVYDVRTPSAARFRGLIPTGWYPSSIDVSPDGRTIAVGTLLGVGSGQARVGGKFSGNALAVRGSVNVIAVPTDAELAAYTTSVAQNARLTLSSGSTAVSVSVGAPAGAQPPFVRASAPARAVPERPGEPSLIRNVVYIIRENRTYDQVLGDIGKGASDPSLVMYGRDVTPNAHALAERFVLLDHFFATGGNSADGHHWLTQANETDYPMWPLYFGRSYPSESDDPLAYSAGGFLWEATAAKGRTVSVFGEFAPPASDSVPAVRRQLLDEYADRTTHDAKYFRARLAKMYDTHSPLPSLDKVLVREYPGWTQEVPDVVKADVVLEHLKEWERAGAMPHLVMIILPSDHTVGLTAGWTSPRANVADNDLALGKLVEGLSHSSFWKSMAILVVEDDAQNGVDHVDGHRTVAFVASPYAKRGAIDSTFYNQQGMVKTIELMLGLPALSIFDLVATDMRASFIGADEWPDAEPYTAVRPQQALDEFNQRVGAISGPHAAERRAAALASSRMDFRSPDAAPSDKLNRILWHDARGWGVPFPAVRRSLFFPFAVEIADEDRQEHARPRR